MRALIVALLLANALFFGWARGWLSPAMPPPQHSQREPARLAAQVQPERVVVMTPQAASAAVAAATATTCVEAGPLSDAEIAGAEAALAAAAVPAGAWTRRELQQPGDWLVYMGRFADAAARRAKGEELRRLKIDFDELAEPPELAPGLVLSRHGSSEDADAALAQAAQRGVHSARVVALPPPPLQHYLRIARANAALQAKLTTLAPALPAAAFTPCKSAG